MLKRPDEFLGLFSGERIPEYESEIKIYGDKERIDEEMCTLDEFKIIKK